MEPSDADVLWRYLGEQDCWGKGYANDMFSMGLLAEELR